MPCTAEAASASALTARAPFVFFLFPFLKASLNERRLLTTAADNRNPVASRSGLARLVCVACKACLERIGIESHVRFYEISFLPRFYIGAARCAQQNCEKKYSNEKFNIHELSFLSRFRASLDHQPQTPHESILPFRFDREDTMLASRVY